MIRILFINSDTKDNYITREALAERYFVNNFNGSTFPLTYQMINKYQGKDKELVDKLKCAIFHNNYFFRGEKFTQIICRNDKIVVPK